MGETIASLKQKLKVAEAEARDWQSRFKKRTIAYGMTRRESKLFESMTKILVELTMSNIITLQTLSDPQLSMPIVDRIEVAEKALKKSKLKLGEVQLMAVKVSDDPEHEQLADYMKKERGK